MQRASSFRRRRDQQGTAVLHCDVGARSICGPALAEWRMHSIGFCRTGGRRTHVLRQVRNVPVPLAVKKIVFDSVAGSAVRNRHTHIDTGGYNLSARAPEGTYLTFQEDCFITCPQEHPRSCVG